MAVTQPVGTRENHSYPVQRYILSHTLQAYSLQCNRRQNQSDQWFPKTGNYVAWSI